MRKAFVAAALLACTLPAEAQLDRGFKIALPCVAHQTGSETHIIMSCQNSDGSFAVEIVSDPAQTPRDRLFAGAMQRLAAELGAQPRLVRDVTRNGNTGREIVTDLTGGQTERDQLWQSPNVLFEIRFKGPTGSEMGKPATDFLDSFFVAP